VPSAAVDFHVSPIVEELMQQPRVRAAAAAAAVDAPELLEDNANDLSELVRAAMWRHCSSVTNKTPLQPPPGRRRTRSIMSCQLSEAQSAGGGTGLVGLEGTVEAPRRERALAVLWASIEDAAESFQRRFIARRFF